MNEQKVVFDFLSKIIIDIEMIDGGCSDCVSSFCETVNVSLLDYELKLKYSEEYPIKVNIELL